MSSLPACVCCLNTSSAVDRGAIYQNFQCSAFYFFALHYYFICVLYLCFALLCFMFHCIMYYLLCNLIVHSWYLWTCMCYLCLYVNVLYMIFMYYLYISVPKLIASLCYIVCVLPTLNNTYLFIIYLFDLTILIFK